jgi:hypothetical protein
LGEGGLDRAERQTKSGKRTLKPKPDSEKATNKRARRRPAHAEKTVTRDSETHIISQPARRVMLNAGLKILFPWAVGALLVLALAVSAQAQNSVPDDIWFDVSFYALPHGPTNSDIQVSAFYDRQLYNVNPFTNARWPVPGMTNLLSINLLGLDSQPASAWVMERELNGNFSPVAAITNYLETFSGLIVAQGFGLTPNQIHALIAGRFYLALDLDKTNYLAKLAPDYSTAQGPYAEALLDPPYFKSSFQGQPHPYGYVNSVVSVGTRKARVLLDASASVDRFYLPMSFTWTVADTRRTILTGSGSQLACQLPPGTFFVSLYARDDMASGYPGGFELDVLTADQAVDVIVGEVNALISDASLRSKLNEILTAAETQFRYNAMLRADASLWRFIVMVNQAQLDQGTKTELIGYAKKILAAE